MRHADGIANVVPINLRSADALNAPPQYANIDRWKGERGLDKVRGRERDREALLGADGDGDALGDILDSEAGIVPKPAKAKAAPGAAPAQKQGLIEGATDVSSVMTYGQVMSKTKERILYFMNAFQAILLFGAAVFAYATSFAFVDTVYRLEITGRETILGVNVQNVTELINIRFGWVVAIALTLAALRPLNIFIFSSFSRYYYRWIETRVNPYRWLEMAIKNGAIASSMLNLLGDHDLGGNAGIFALMLVPYLNALFIEYAEGRTRPKVLWIAATQWQFWIVTVFSGFPVAAYLMFKFIKIDVDDFPTTLFLLFIVMLVFMLFDPLNFYLYRSGVYNYYGGEIFTIIVDTLKTLAYVFLVFIGGTIENKWIV
jgi:hypothetical protein